MSGGAEQVGDQLNGCVNEETNEHTRRNDFRVRALLLIQVPCAADAQKIAAVTGSVQN